MDVFDLTLTEADKEYLKKMMDKTKSDEIKQYTDDELVSLKREINELCDSVVCSSHYTNTRINHQETVLSINNVHLMVRLSRALRSYVPRSVRFRTLDIVQIDYLGFFCEKPRSIFRPCWDMLKDTKISLFHISISVVKAKVLIKRN